MNAFSADDLFAHRDALCRLARDLVVDEALAEDVVQQAYVVALTRPPRERRSLAGWLRAVVRSCSLDVLRQDARRRRREGARAADLPSTPAEVAERLELQEALAAAVRRLGEPYRSVVWLRYFEGLAPSEIATRQGEPVKTIKTRLLRSLQSLRSALDARPGGRERWLAAMVPWAQWPTGSGVEVSASTLAKTLVPVAFVAAAALAVGFWSTRAPSLVPSGASAQASHVALAGDATAATEATASAVSGREVPNREAALVGAVAQQVQVRVVGSDGAPVADAVVWYGEPMRMAMALDAAGLDRAQRQALHHDTLSLYQRFGKAVRSDEHGVVRWPWSPSEGRSTQWLGVTLHAGEFGEAWVRRDAAPDVVHELALRPDRGCSALVLDAQRQPVAGVPVDVVYAQRDGDGRRSTDSLGSSDADGRVFVRHVQTWCERIAPEGAALPAALRIALPGLEVACAFDANALPSEPLVLWLPAHGGLRLQVLDAEGAPVVDQPWVIREHEVEAARWCGATTDAAGFADFPQVGLGRTWQVRRDRVEPGATQLVVGPRAAGEVVTAPRRAAPAPVLLGRLVQEGVPVATVGFGMTPIAAGRELVGVRGTTDGEGRFRLVLGAAFCDLPVDELRIHPDATGEGSAGTCAVWRGPHTLAAGVHDLGVLSLTVEPIVVAGQLVAPPGTELPADVRVHVQVATDAVASVWEWASLRHRRRADGSFTLFGTVANGPLRLFVTTTNRFVAVPARRFVAGEKGLRIELQHGGSLRASIVAADQLAAFCQVPLLVPMAGGGEVQPFAFNPELDPRVPREHGFVGDAPWETEFIWPAVAPGRYQLEVWSRGLHRPLHVVRDLVVEDGRRTEDARVQHLVVPGVRTVELDLPQAESVAELLQKPGKGVVVVLDGDRPAGLCWQVDSRMVMFASVAPLDVRVRLRGYRDRVVRAVVGKQRIELEPGIALTLRIVGGAFASTESLRVELTALDDPIARERPQLYSAAAGGSIPGFGGLVLSAECVGGEAQLALPIPGRYRVAAYVRSAGGIERPFDMEPAEIPVGDAGGRITLTVRP